MLVPPILMFVLGISESAMALSRVSMANQINLSHDGWFRLTGGMPFIPLGGFHANVIPMSLLSLSEA